MRYVRALSIMVGVVLVGAIAVAQIPTTSVVTEAGPPPSAISAGTASDATIVSLVAVDVDPCKYPCEAPKPTVPTSPPTTTAPPTTAPATTAPATTAPDRQQLDCGTVFLEYSDSRTVPGNFVYSFAGRVDMTACSDFDPTACSQSNETIVLNGTPLPTPRLPIEVAIHPTDALPGSASVDLDCPTGKFHATWILQDAKTSTPD